MSVDQINAEMAGAAEREHLESRVVQLEAEVRQLRNALATILDAAATGIAAPGLTDRSPTTPDRLTPGEPQPAPVPRHRL